MVQEIGVRCPCVGAAQLKSGAKIPPHNVTAAQAAVHERLWLNGAVVSSMLREPVFTLPNCVLG